jgi:hypothetical protein
MANPILIIGLGALAYMLFKDKEGVSGGVSVPSGARNVPQNTTECQIMEGIYITPDPGKLPLTRDAVEKAEAYILDLMAQDALIEKDAAVYMAAKHLTSHFSTPCPWGQDAFVSDPNRAGYLPSTDPMVGFKTVMQRVWGGLEVLFDSMDCENLFGTWHESVGGNLPVTKAFFEDAEAHIKAREASAQPYATPASAAMDTLETLVPSCQWRDVQAFTPRQKDVYEATKKIYEQIKYP